MALLGTGYVPGGAVGAELEDITRRAYIPKYVVQIGQATPFLAALLANAKPASGGLSSVTVPLQGAAFVTPQVTDFYGSFAAPSQQTGTQNAEFNLAAYVTPIGFLGFESLVQLDAAVIPRIEAVMNDAGNQTALFMNTDVFATPAVNPGLHIDSLAKIAQAANVYGNINSALAANDYWRANVKTDTGLPTRKKMAQWIASATQYDQGEMPTLGLLNIATWAALQEDFIGIENIYLRPGEWGKDQSVATRSAFAALTVNGVPLYADPGLADGVLYLLNMRYLSMYIHEAAAFAFTGFASALPVRQLGYIGALVTVLQMLVTKRKSVTIVTGFTALSL